MAPGNLGAFAIMEGVRHVRKPCSECAAFWHT
jgi:hypothetical protein